MVLEIRLRNFYSIKEEVILDLRAGALRTKSALDLKGNSFTFGKEQILKSAAIYGANASGKSNVVKAVVSCCRVILDSHLYNENSLFNFQPFNLNKSASEPSYFFIRFVEDSIEYEYSFSLTRKEIITEELYYYPKNRRARIFTRNESLGDEKQDIYNFSNIIRSPMTVADNTSKKSLYLSRASQMDRELPKQLYRFFTEELLLGAPAIEGDYALQLFHANRELILHAMQLADSDIIDIQIERQNVSSTEFRVNPDKPQSISAQDTTGKMFLIKSYHRSAPSVAFDFNNEESEGTKRLFYLILRMLDVLKYGKTIIIDEIDLHLHSHLSEFLITLFHKSKDAQLIFTTHNTNLLDLSKLRKDQIWFVNKNEKAFSELYSLFDFKDFRDNMNLEKGYLQGRFDAVPIIEPSSSALEKLFNE